MTTTVLQNPKVTITRQIQLRKEQVTMSPSTYTRAMTLPGDLARVGVVSAVFMLGMQSDPSLI